MIFMALGTLPPPLLPALPLPHQHVLPAGRRRRPLRRAINTKDELLEGSHVLVALGSSVRSFVTFVLLKVRIIQAMKMMLLCWYQTRLKRGVSISVMAVIPSTYRLVRYAHFLSQTSSLMLMWPGLQQHRDVPPCLDACRRAAARLTDVPKPASYLVEVAIWYFLAVLWDTMMLHSGSYLLGMRCAMYVDNVLSVVFRASCYTSTDRLSKVVLIVQLSNHFLCWRYKILIHFVHKNVCILRVTLSIKLTHSVRW